MHTNNYSLSDLISVHRTTNQNNLPFTYKFKENKTSKDIRKVLAGTGIYLISWEGEVIYIGKYQPTSGNIVADRWARHLETITFRGSSLGFGKTRNPAKRAKKLIEAAADQRLAEIIISTLTIEPSRFSVTGYNTSENRVRFAGSKWNYLEKASEANILEHFQFSLFKIKPADSIAEAEKQISLIEVDTLKTFNPCCNKEFKKDLHSEHRIKNTFANISEEVCIHINTHTGSDFVDCVTFS